MIFIAEATLPYFFKYSIGNKLQNSKVCVYPEKYWESQTVQYLIFRDMKAHEELWVAKRDNVLLDMR